MRPKNPLQTLLYSLCLVAFILGGTQILAVRADAEFDLAIGLKAPQHVAPGSDLLINLSYSNIGTAASPDDTFVQVVLPEGVSFVSAVDQDQNPIPPTVISGSVFTWTVGVLAADSCCAHIWITTSVAADLAEGTMLSTSAHIGSGAPEINLANNQASVTTQVCDMAGSGKEADLQQAKPGDVITYTITLRLAQRLDEGENRARTVTLTDILPPAAQARFLGWVGESTGTYDGQMLHWQGRVSANDPVMLQYRLGVEGNLLPGHKITNRARVQWSGGDLDLDPTEVSVVMTDDDHMFGPGGGEWQHAWGLTLTVPPDGVSEMTRFQFKPVFETPPDAPPGWQFAHRAFELTAFQFGEVHQFNQPITITLRYSYGDVGGVLTNSLRLWYRAGQGEPWAMLGEPIQHREGQISFTTDHFTEFALFGQKGFQVVLPMVVR